MKNVEILPFGSIVSLKEGGRKLMIIGLNQTNSSNNKIYDYCGLLHPFGYLNSDDLFLFNSDKIDKVYFKGYFDEESREYYEDSIWLRKRIGGDSNG